MSQESTRVSFSLEFAGFVCWLVFLILKCTHVIDWNWFWVWFPLWIPLALDLAVVLIIAVIAFLVGVDIW